MTMSAPEVIESATDLLQLKARIDLELDRRSSFEGEPDCPAVLREAIRYCLLGPGKRLRPILVLLAAEACEGNQDVALPAACAVEMIHTYSLVHDDLPAMDDDALRRGRPTLHIRFDEATAILAGDALIPLAFETLCHSYPPAVAARCCRELARAAGACRLVGGQVDDLAQEKNSSGNLDHLERIHRRKTGALLAVSLRLGGIVANATEPQLAALERFGTALGLAFQIVDDLLDYRGDSTRMGKRAGKDSGRGKLTYPGLLGVEASERRARALIAEARQALEGFGSRSAPLQQLAQYVLERNH